MDRKIVVALLARELRESLERFVRGFAESLRLYLGVEPEEFQAYIIDALPEALALIKDHKKSEEK